MPDARQALADLRQAARTLSVDRDNVAAAQNLLGALVGFLDAIEPMLLISAGDPPTPVILR